MKVYRRLALERTVPASHRAALALIGQGLRVEHEQAGSRVGVTGLIDGHRHLVAHHDFVEVRVANIQAIRMWLIQFSRQFALGFRHSFDSLERNAWAFAATRPSVVESGQSLAPRIRSALVELARPEGAAHGIELRQV